jgi:hypothetical protein
VGPRVQRRKAQRKAKRRRYSRCSVCGGRATCHAKDGVAVKQCWGWNNDELVAPGPPFHGKGCGTVQVLGWTGGKTQGG